MPIQNIDNYLMPNRSQEVSIHRLTESSQEPMKPIMQHLGTMALIPEKRVITNTT